MIVLAVSAAAAGNVAADDAALDALTKVGYSRIKQLGHKIYFSLAPNFIFHNFMTKLCFPNNLFCFFCFRFEHRKNVFFLFALTICNHSNNLLILFRELKFL